MSNLYNRAFLLLSDQRNLRWILIGLTLVGMMVSLGAPDSVAACTPPGDGTSGCAPN